MTVLIPRLTAAACAAALALTSCSGDDADQATTTAREWQDDMLGAINPLLVAFEHETGVDRELWRDGPITAGCVDGGARARQSFHFTVSDVSEGGQLVEDTLHTLIDFLFEAPIDLREHYAGETITYTSNERTSFHEVTEFWRDDYVLTLIVHAAPGEQRDQLVLVVDAYSTCS